MFCLVTIEKISVCQVWSEILKKINVSNMAKLAPLPNRVLPSTAFTNSEDGPPKEKGIMLTAAGNPNAMRMLTPGDPMAVAGQGNELLGQDQFIYFDYNMHALKKGMSSALLDVALLMANVSQLKSLVLAGPKHPFYALLMVLLISSLLLQLLSALLVVFLGRININVPDSAKHKQAEILVNVFLVAIFLLTVINIFISALDVSDQEIAASNTATVICNQIYVKDQQSNFTHNK